MHILHWRVKFTRCIYFGLIFYISIARLHYTITSHLNILDGVYAHILYVSFIYDFILFYIYSLYLHIAFRFCIYLSYSRLTSDLHLF